MFQLLTSQKNDLFLAVNRNGLSPSDFEWEEKSFGIIGPRPALVYKKNLEFYFMIGWFDGLFELSYSPGRQIQTASAEVNEWVKVATLFENWLKYIRREIDTPDLWQTVLNNKQLFEDVDQQPDDNFPFTNEELPKVREALAEIKAYLFRISHLTESQKKTITDRFDYLEDCANRFGRKDWLHIFMSVVVGIGLNYLQSGEELRALLTTTRDLFKHILGTVLYLAGPH